LVSFGVIETNCNKFDASGNHLETLSHDTYRHGSTSPQEFGDK